MLNIAQEPTAHNRFDRFTSHQEFVRVFGADDSRLVAANLSGFRARDSNHLAKHIPDQIPREAWEDAHRLVGSEISYSPDALRRVANGVKYLSRETQFSGIDETFNQALEHSEVLYLPSKQDLATVTPNIVVGDSFNSSEAKTHSHKLLWLAKVLFDKFQFKDIMLPNVSVNFFNTGTNSGVVANGGFMAFDFLDIGNANRVNNRDFIKNTLLANREVRKLLDLSRVKVVYDNKGIRIYLSMPDISQLETLGIQMSERELNTLKVDLGKVLLGLDGEPAVRFRSLSSSPEPHSDRTKLPIGLLMSFDPKTILEEITPEMPEHLKDRILNDYHWFTDPEKRALILHYEYSNSPGRDRNLDSSEILTAVRQYNTYPEVNVKLMSDMNAREYSLFLDSLE